MDGLLAEFVKEARHTDLPIANSDWESLVADCWLRKESVKRKFEMGKSLLCLAVAGKKVYGGWQASGEVDLMEVLGRAKESGLGAIFGLRIL